MHILNKVYRLLPVFLVALSVHLPAQQSFDFTEVEIQLEDVDYGAIDFGDFDGDGDLDLLVFGENPDNNRVGIIYVNTGGTFHPDSQITLPIAFRICDAKWFDFDADNDLDILISGNKISKISTILENQAGTFVDIDPGFVGMEDSAVDWADFDNDGDYDCIITGRDNAINRPCFIYQNSGGNFSQLEPGISGAQRGDVNFIDFDQDGDKDVFITGYGDDGRVTQLYSNDNGSFTNTGFSFSTMMLAASDWGDYDNDGDPDLLLTGSYNDGVSEVRLSLVYENDLTVFNEKPFTIDGVYDGDAKWADFNNDGLLDIIVTGKKSISGKLTKIFKNEGGSSFAQVSQPFPGMDNAALALGDYNRDGRLDLAICGTNDAGEPKLIIYKNNTDGYNNPPEAPVNLVVNHIGGSTVEFIWTRGMDTESDSMSLSYNIRIGTSPGMGDILSANTVPITDHYMLAKRGNMGQALNTTVSGFEEGTYYWAIQAVDHGFLTSPFKEGPGFQFEGAPSITVNTPNGGENWIAGQSYNITWNDNIDQNVKIELHKGGFLERAIVSDIPSNGLYNWTLPSDLTEGDTYQIKISQNDDDAIHDYSELFTVSAAAGKTITVLKPKDEDAIKIGDQQNIEWQSSNINNVDIFFRLNDTDNWKTIDSNVLASNRIYQWEVTGSHSIDCAIKISDSEEPGIFDLSEGHFTIIDTIKPVITASFAPEFIDYNYKGDVEFRCTINDHSPLTTALLRYRIDMNESYESYALTNSGANEYTAMLSLDGSALLSGIEYHFLAEDEPGNTTITSSGFVRLNFPDGIHGAYSLPWGKELENFRLISIPLDLNDKAVDSFLSYNVINNYDPNSFRLFSVEGDNINEYPNIDPIHPGDALFAITNRSNFHLNCGPGKTLDESMVFIKSMQAGWNVFGTPFNISVSLDRIFVTQGGFELWTFDGSWSAVQAGLQPWEGYAVYMSESANLTIHPKPQASNNSNQILSQLDKMIQVIAEDASGRDHFNYIGLSAEETDATYKSLHEPPRLGNQISLYMEIEDERLSAIMEESSGEYHQWNLVCEPDLTNRTFTLQFNNLEILPDAFDAFLVDQNNGTVFNLAKQNELEFINTKSTKRDFLLICGKKEILQTVFMEKNLYPETLQLCQNYPNPFNPVTQIRYALPQAGKVRITVYNLLGEVVNRLLDTFQEQGNHTIVWNAQNMPSGVYFYKLEFGNKQKLIKKCTLIK